MGKIFFSMAGEGRGHATRVRALVEPLRERGHQIWLFTPGAAHELLAPVYRSTDVRVVRIPGLMFHYGSNRKLAYLRTGGAALKYFREFPRLRRRLVALMRRERPDLVVTDFEPALPRAARRCGIPFLSVNHQHFLVVNDLGELPLSLRWHAWYMSWIVRAYYSGQAATVVSQFYFPPVKRRHADTVVQAGCLLRPEIVSASPANEGHLVAYLRKFATPQVLAALRDCGREVRLYGLGERPREGNIAHCRIDDRQFIADLASCDALVCTAGNQLVGEALYLGKPVFAMPEANNFEQYINAHYLRASGAGEWVDLERVTTGRLRQFLARLDEYRARIQRERMNGTPVALEAIERHLAARAGMAAPAPRPQRVA